MRQHIVPLLIVELEDRNYHLLAACRFENGAEGFWVIDTGASKTVFDKNLADHYDLLEDDADTEIRSAGIGESILETSLGRLHPFSLNGLTVEQMKVALLDLAHINRLYYEAADRHICGLIGSDFLLHYRAVIDYGTQEMALDAVPTLPFD